MTATKAPTGLSIKRQDNRLEFSWKASDKDIIKQEMKWWVFDKSETEIVTFNNGNVTGYTTPTLSNLFYNGAGGNWSSDYWQAWSQYLWGCKTLGAAFRVRQLRQPYTETYYENVTKKVGGKTKTVKEKKTRKVTPTWSDWERVEISFTPPNSPAVSYTAGQELYTSTWSWNVSGVDTTNLKPFMRVAWQFLQVTNSDQSDGSKLDWSTVPINYSTSTSGSVTRSVDASNVAKGSATGWFRAIAIGYGRWYDWQYTRRIFAYPYQATITALNADYYPDTNNYLVDVTWNTTVSFSHPTNSANVEWAKGVPIANLAPPDSPSWQGTDDIRRKGASDRVKFRIDGRLEDDNCLFLRVNTAHDNFTTEGQVKIAAKGNLKPPTISNAIAASNNKYTIRANNISTVPNSFLAVYYKNMGNPSNVWVIGVIPNGSSEVTVQGPDPQDNEVAFGVRAFVGGYTQKNASGAVGSYAINDQMHSESIVWAANTVPAPPADVTVSAIEGREDALKVTWRWSWAAATHLELSWSDHEDAWHSTDAPSTFMVDATNKAEWNIAGVETGKTWYVSARFIKESDELTIKSAWSDPVSINLATAPEKPILALSDTVVKQGADITGSWQYVSTDGTGQSYAEICIVTRSSSGVISYGDKIARAETAQHVSFSSDGFSTTSPNMVAVRVASASGLLSPWSDPVAFNVASPITVSIASSSIRDLTRSSVSLIDNGAVDVITQETYDEGDVFIADEAKFGEYITAGETFDVTRFVEVGNDTIPADYTETTYAGEHAFETTKTGQFKAFYNGNDVSVYAEFAYEDNTLNYTLPKIDGVIDFNSGDSVYVLFYPDDEVVVWDSYGGNPTFINPDNIGIGFIRDSLTKAYTIGGNITSTSYKALTEMPLTITADGTGEIKTWEFAVERVGTYEMLRPDETVSDGYDKETVALLTADNKSVVITEKELIGYLDDGADYRIVVTGKDAAGQTAEASLGFVVEWEHQALLPTAVAETDDERSAVKITPVAPAGTMAGDKFDIYRLSADRPEKIIEGGTWGETYVDPYPALGNNGGHRVVFISKNGDYITEDNTPAWIDLRAEHEDWVSDEYALIDFDGGTIRLSRNLDTSNQWAKDFTETQYLGGSVTGDWNPAVSRTGSLGTVAVTLLDNEQILLMRRLAVYAGICHVRTRDGSSFACNIDVSETRDHAGQDKIVSFSLSITRIDPEGFEGVTLKQWEAENELE